MSAPPARATAAATPAGRQRPWWIEALLYLGIAALVAAAWLLVRALDLHAASDSGYWLGVAGGCMMLLLFAYPLRKRLRVMARWGAAKWWFAVHMVLGIGGPWLVLVHSGFQIGSLNAGVALYSMLIVAGSGVVGRFLYLRIHRGLSGERQSLAQLQQSLGLQHDGLHSALGFSPLLERSLLRFETYALAGQGSLRQHLRAYTLLPLRHAATRERCLRALRPALRKQAGLQGWDETTRRRQHRLLRQTVIGYLQAVQRVAQFQAAVRLFSLWHVLHVPFVYLMVICAVAHVIAVHAY